MILVVEGQIKGSYRPEILDETKLVALSSQRLRDIASPADITNTLGARSLVARP